MRPAVIISAYNNYTALYQALHGYLVQTHSDFEIVIADDGSNQQMAQVVNDPRFSSLEIRHVWHEDEGFRLSAIRNRAISSTDSEYLIFCDADCIPRNDFVAQHVKHARPNYFISGGRINVAQRVHCRFTEEDISSGRVFDIDFLIKQDPGLRRCRWRLQRNRLTEPILNFLTMRLHVFAGSNASAWRKDLLAVNGFDESFTGYGSEDRDLGIRLHNNGVRSRYLKFSLVQMHLDHPQKYCVPEIAAANRRRFRRRISDGTTRIVPGIDALPVSG